MNKSRAIGGRGCYKCLLYYTGRRRMKEFLGVSENDDDVTKINFEFNSKPTNVQEY
jgi:hypothetical protein